MIEFFPAREVAIDLFGWEIRWYGVLYLVAFGIVWYLLPRLAEYRDLKLSREDWLYVLTLGIAGVLVGGRVGFVLFYEPVYFLAHPKELFFLWQGGMSWHGGLVGVGLALWLASRRLRVNIWRLADVVVAPAMLGLAVGRLGNVINGELFVGSLAQFLAVAVNVFMAGVLYWYLQRREWQAGMAAALFFILAGLVRFGMEYVRTQEYALVLGLSRGQLLSLIIVVAGGLLVIWQRQSGKERQ